MTELSQNYPVVEIKPVQISQGNLGIWLIRLVYLALAISGMIDLLKTTSTSGLIGAGIRVAAALMIASSELLIQRKKVMGAGLMAMSVSIIALFLMGMMDHLNIGWFIGLVIGFMLSLISIQLLPPAWMGRGIFIAFTGGALVAFTDYFNHSTRYYMNFSDPQVMILFAISAIMAGILFLRFANYPVNAKLVLAVASLTTLILNILGVIVLSRTGNSTDIPPVVMQSMNDTFLAGSQLGIVLSSLMALILARFITQPLTAIVEVVDQIAKDGNLNLHTAVVYHDEVGRMAEAFNHMMDTLNDMAQKAHRLAEGDLTVEFTPRSKQDVLGIAFEWMTGSLRTLVGQIWENADQVNEASQGLVNAAQLANLASEQISRAMTQVAQGAIQQASVATATAGSVEQMQGTIRSVEQGVQRQSQAVTQATQLTNKIMDAIQQVHQDAKTGVNFAVQTMKEADKGAHTIQQTITGMSTIQARVEDSALKVQEMKRRSDQIGNILEVIEEIASQINLLSLNAALEAARAGEQGKGFAVVADEVRKLAEKSTAATKEIGGLIANIHTATQETVVAMTAGLNEVKSGMDRAGSAGQALGTIVDTVRTMQQQVSRIADSAVLVDTSANGLRKAMQEVNLIVEQNIAASQAMLDRSNEVTNSVENIASISEENSASAEEVSASVDEMTIQMTSVNQSAEMLTEMSMALQDQVQQFIL